MVEGLYVLCKIYYGKPKGRAKGREIVSKVSLGGISLRKYRKV